MTGPAEPTHTANAPEQLVFSNNGERPLRTSMLANAALVRQPKGACLLHDIVAATAGIPLRLFE